MKTYKTLFLEGHPLDKYSPDAGMQRYFDEAKPKKIKCDPFFAKHEEEFNRVVEEVMDFFTMKPRSNPLNIENGYDLVRFSAKVGGFLVNLDNLRYNERLWYGYNNGKEAKHPTEGWQIACKKFISGEKSEGIIEYGFDDDNPDFDDYDKAKKQVKLLQKQWKMMCESAYDNGPFFVPKNKFK